jgi:hypothetical protein
MLTGLISELDAVNKIIAISGDSPVQTLEDEYIQAKLARQILTRASRDIQAMGWWFNEEQEVPLTPDLNGYVTLATNIIACAINDDDGSIIQRGRRMYNRTDRTYSFTETLSADIITGLEWDELPQTARAHIVAQACIIYNNDFFGAQEIKAVLDTDLQTTYLVLKRADIDSRDINLLRSSRVYNIAFKNRRS